MVDPILEGRVVDGGRDGLGVGLGVAVLRDVREDNADDHVQDGHHHLDYDHDGLPEFADRTDLGEEGINRNKKIATHFPCRFE